jgi:hypothetical protein
MIGDGDCGEIGGMEIGHDLLLNLYLFMVHNAISSFTVVYGKKDGNPAV